MTSGAASMALSRLSSEIEVKQLEHLIRAGACRTFCLPELADRVFSYLDQETCLLLLPVCKHWACLLQRRLVQVCDIIPTLQKDAT